MRAEAETGGSPAELPPGDKDPDIENGKQHVVETSSTADAVVDFDGDADPENPLNWSKPRRWFLLILVSFMSTIMTLATVVCAPAVPQILQHFGSDNSYSSILLVSVWEIGQILGPLILAPLSELYGRLPVWHTACILFVVFSVATALSNSLGMVIAFRFLNGIVSPIVIASGITSDLFRREERGKAMTAAGFTPLIGPTFGPTIGGYISQDKGWRWTFWFVGIASAGVESLLLIFLRETYATKILKTKARRLMRENGREDLKPKVGKDLRPRILFFQSIVRPLKFLLFSPIVMMMSLYLGIVYGYLYIILTTLTEVLQNTYGFSAKSAGLSFIGMGIGLACGSISCYILLDKLVERLRAGGAAKPEHRLPVLFIGNFVVPTGLFIYGWTVEKGTHWIVPIIGTGFIGVGLTVTSVTIQTYLVDAYTLYAASAIAAGIVFRYISGAILPLAGPPLYANLGYGWGNSLLGFVALAFVPLPLVFYWYGERLRARFKIEV